MKRRPALRSWVRGVFLALALLLVSEPVVSHDLWIIPGAYRLRTGETTRVFINSGDVFPEGLTLVTQPRIAELLARGPEGDVEVTELRVDGKSLTFEFQSAVAGVHVLALATKPRRVRLKGEDFDDYLTEEGLVEIQSLRESRGEKLEAAVERYAKWAKAVVDVGDAVEADTTPWSEPVGHPLEIVPLVHPNRVLPGGELALRVLYEGEPVAGAPVRGGRVSGPPDAISGTTNEKGEVVVPIPSTGRWFVKAIHMIEMADDAEVEFDSFWCTLTFEVSPPREVR